MISVIPLSFGTQLGALLEAQGLTVNELAAASGLLPGYVDELICNRQILTADVAFALGEVLALSPLYLLELQRRFYLKARDQKRVTVL